MNKTISKFEVGQYFIQKAKGRIFKIVDAEWKGIITKPSKSKVKESTTIINDWLYDIEYVNPDNDGKPVYGRYYENRLTEECVQVLDQKLPKAIYG